MDISRGLEEAGIELQALGNVVGDGQPSGSTPRGNSEDATVAIGVLARIAAELAGVSGELLSGTRHYAGAALLRQVVEIEYLTWAFANEVRDAADWLNSTHEDRMSLFTPAKLRTTSGGRFNAKDYRDHCEQGGHPVPGAVGLIDGSGGLAAQMLLVDLLLHCWRTADNVAHWFQNSSNAPAAFPYALRAAKRVLAAWGEQDPLYPWLCSVSPAPDPEL